MPTPLNILLCNLPSFHKHYSNKKPFRASFFLMVSMNAFHSTNLFCCFSRYQAPANSVAPTSVHKPHTTHNSSIRSDEGVTLETSAFESLYVVNLRCQFTLSTQFIKPNLSNKEYIIGHSKDYNGVGALRGQRQKLT